MRTVTLEEHFSTPEVVKATAHLQSGSRSGFVEVVRDKLLDLGEGRIADMDAAGIDVQVLSLVNSGMDKLEPATATALVRDANDQLAAAVRTHPDRFAAFAALALQDPKAAAAEFERCVCKLGFKGALVHGTINGVFLDQPQFAPLFETAQALGRSHLPASDAARSRCRRHTMRGCPAAPAFSYRRRPGDGTRNLGCIACA